MSEPYRYLVSYVRQPSRYGHVEMTMTHPWRYGDTSEISDAIAAGTEGDGPAIILSVFPLAPDPDEPPDQS
ncbi:MAG TPA: hypothetical protein VFI46_17775 [Jiangellaceae bacterium]|nr:hypothetical protein [Jiangellaceae bacterium]